MTRSGLRTARQSFGNRAAGLVYLFRFGMVTPLPTRREICSIRTTSKIDELSTNGATWNHLTFMQGRVVGNESVRVE